jgi:hypothetical protein
MKISQLRTYFIFFLKITFIFMLSTTFIVIYAQVTDGELDSTSSANANIILVLSRPRNTTAVSRAPVFVLDKCKKELINICPPIGQGNKFGVILKSLNPNNKDEFSVIDNTGNKTSYSVNLDKNNTKISSQSAEKSGAIPRGLNKECASETASIVTIDYGENICENFNNSQKGGLKILLKAE